MFKDVILKVGMLEAILSESDLLFLSHDIFSRPVFSVRSLFLLSLEVTRQPGEKLISSLFSTSWKTWPLIQLTSSVVMLGSRGRCLSRVLLIFRRIFCFLCFKLGQVPDQK